MFFFLQSGCFCLSQHDLMAFVTVICPPDARQENRSPSLLQQVWWPLVWSLGGRGQFGHTWNTDLGVEDSPSEGETGTWQSQPWARRERETKWVPGMVTQFPPSTCSVWPCCPWRWPVPFRWNTLGPLSSQGRGHWALSQAWGTWLHHFLPVSAWTSYFILNLSVSVSLSLKQRQ